MIFRLTKTDFDEALRRNIFQCPIAKCIKRILNKEKVSVNQSRIMILDKTDYLHSYPTPQKVSKYIANFDNGLITKFESFEFQLPIKK